VIYYEKGIMQEEDEIRSEVTHIVHKEVDLVSLNIAPASLISNVFRIGVPLVIKDKGLYWELYLRASNEAEDFSRFCEDFYKIKQRANSLSKEAREKLMVRIDFFTDRVKEIDRFRKFTWQEYQEDIDKRRIIERWVENTINALIDITKIVLASEGREMPRSYEESLLHFGILADLSEEEARKFSKFANLRNILAHEYHQKIQDFIKEWTALEEKIKGFLDKYLEIKYEFWCSDTSDKLFECMLNFQRTEIPQLLNICSKGIFERKQPFEKGYSPLHLKKPLFEK